MIKIVKESKRVLLQYIAEDRGIDWVDQALQDKGKVTLGKRFSFQINDFLSGHQIYSWPCEDRVFCLGLLKGNYFKVPKRILGLKYDLLLHKSLKLSRKSFIAERDISIFRKIDGLSDEPIIVGGDTETAIPISEFEELLKNFPTSTELTRYSEKRVAGVVRDYLQTMPDAEKRFQDFLNRKKTIKSPSRVEFLSEYEPQKFEYVRDHMVMMLDSSDRYSEKDWQALVAQFLLVIFPKYVAILEELHVKDCYSNKNKITRRRIDMALVDAGGAIDILEIKKPVFSGLLAKAKYRDNHVPRHELSGTIMQVEKYIFHLNKWGREGEKKISEKRGHQLLPNLEVRITNPKALLLLGRDNEFDEEQRLDFEIIRRKYANVIDIMTYDDLLRRLDNIIASIGKNYSQLNQRELSEHAKNKEE